MASRDTSRWPSRWGAGQSVQLPTFRTTARPKDEDWRHRAACAGEDSDLFFPIGTSDLAHIQVEKAKLCCARCPVSEDCLDFALTTRQEAGVWGGLEETERKTLLRKRSRTGGGTA